MNIFQDWQTFGTSWFLQRPLKRNEKRERIRTDLFLMLSALSWDNRAWARNAPDHRIDPCHPNTIPTNKHATLPICSPFPVVHGRHTLWWRLRAWHHERHIWVSHQDGDGLESNCRCSCGLWDCYQDPICKWSSFGVMRVDKGAVVQRRWSGNVWHNFS